VKLAVRLPRTSPGSGSESHPIGFTARRWSRSPACIGVATGVVALAFASLRFAVAARGNIAAFIVVGANHAQRSRLSPGVPVSRGSGYDGQFYYRLALDPLGWGHRAFGITLDTAYRIDRIGYPALAWLAAGGHGPFVPVTLVLVNVVALGVLAGLGAALCRTIGRSPLWGLVFAGYWGLLWSLSRDLTEVVTAAGIIGGLLALRRDRPVMAALALTVAVLSRESVLVLLGALCLSRLIDWARTLAGASPPRNVLPKRSGRSGPSAIDLAWVFPLLAFAAWQAAIATRIGVFPFTAARGDNVGVPFVGFSRGFVHYLNLFPSMASLLWFAELTLLVFFGILAALSYQSSEAYFHERLAWIGYGLLSISLAPGVWLGDVGFRSLDEFFLLSWLLLICSRQRLRYPAALVGAAWVVVAVELVLYI
jgi:hypothetical protein